jgi:hypothetical protein
MTKIEYSKAMSEAGKIIAYGLNGCPRGGHRLRTAGGCPQWEVADTVSVLEMSS